MTANDETMVNVIDGSPKVISTVPPERLNPVKLATERLTPHPTGDNDDHNRNKTIISQTIVDECRDYLQTVSEGFLRKRQLTTIDAKHTTAQVLCKYLKESENEEIRKCFVTIFGSVDVDDQRFLEEIRLYWRHSITTLPCPTLSNVVYYCHLARHAFSCYGNHDYLIFVHGRRQLLAEIFQWYMAQKRAIQAFDRPTCSYVDFFTAMSDPDCIKLFGEDINVYQPLELCHESKKEAFRCLEHLPYTRDPYSRPVFLTTDVDGRPHRGMQDSTRGRMIEKLLCRYTNNFPMPNLRISQTAPPSSYLEVPESYSPPLMANQHQEMCCLPPPPPLLPPTSSMYFGQPMISGALYPPNFANVPTAIPPALQTQTVAPNQCSPDSSVPFEFLRDAVHEYLSKSLEWVRLSTIGEYLIDKFGKECYEEHLITKGGFRRSLLKLIESMDGIGVQRIENGHPTCYLKQPLDGMYLSGTDSQSVPFEALYDAVRDCLSKSSEPMLLSNVGTHLTHKFGKTCYEESLRTKGGLKRPLLELIQLMDDIGVQSSQEGHPICYLKESDGGMDLSDTQSGSLAEHASSIGDIDGPSAGCSQSTSLLADHDIQLTSTFWSNSH